MVLIPRFRYVITIKCCCLCLLLLTLVGSCQGFVVYHQHQQYHGSHLVGFSFRGRIERAACHSWRQQQHQLLAKSNNDFDPNSDVKTDDDLLVTLVDKGIQLFAPPTNTNSLLPPPGYLLIWAALVAFTSWIQFGFTIALYGGSKLLVDQLDQEYSSDDDEMDDDTVDELSNNSLVDLFCFLASVVLGTILIAPISSPASDTTASNASSADPLSIVAGSALAVLAVAVIVSGNTEQEDDEGTIASRQLMNMWDNALQQKTSMADRKNDDYKP